MILTGTTQVAMYMDIANKKWFGIEMITQAHHASLNSHGPCGASKCRIEADTGCLS
jgi:hypothetical protein